MALPATGGLPITTTFEKVSRPPESLEAFAARMKHADSSRLGKAVEHLVAASCILSSRAELNVSTALVDDEGVDLVFHMRGGTATLAVQVKSRMSDPKQPTQHRFMAFVRSQTFTPRPDFHALFALVDVERARFDMLWLVPSSVVATLRKNRQGSYRFIASSKEQSQDRWSSYRVRPEELHRKILTLLYELDDEQEAVRLWRETRRKTTTERA